MAVTEACAACGKSSALQCSQCSQVSYCCRGCQKNHWKSHKKECSLFEIKDIPGAGRGLVTRKNIKAGQLILQEGAQMVLEAEEIEEQNISDKLKTLKPEDREKFATLQGKTGAVVSPHCDRFTTNAVSIDNKQYGLFLTLAMLNHSCVPNAVWGSTDCAKTLELRAMKDIKPGVEVTVNYIGDKCLLMSPSERNKVLSDTWAFTCTCQACHQDNDQQARKLLILLKNKMREKLCLSSFEDLFKLHKQKMLALQKMEAVNHQELLNCFQVSVLLAVFSSQPSQTVAGQLTAWQACTARDGLRESRTAWQDLDRSFKDGTPCNMEEFYDNNSVRKEWVQWIYNKL